MARTFSNKLHYEADNSPLIPQVPRKLNRRREISPEVKEKNRLELRAVLSQTLHSDLPEKSFALLLAIGLVGYAYLSYATGSMEYALEHMPRLLNSAAVILGDFLF